MTADLAERLRNEADVWERMDPIYGTTAGLEALLREAADAIDSLTAERDASEHNRLRDNQVLAERLAAAERWMRHAQNDHADECGTCVEFAKTTVAYSYEWNREHADDHIRGIEPTDLNSAKQEGE